MTSTLTRAERWALTALGFLVAVTAAWWALALWPLPDAPPAWLERTRAVCFNAGPTGLPDPSGWILLVGQPLGMLGTLLAGWKTDVLSALRVLGRSWSGRSAMGTVAIAVVFGAGAAATRVATARQPSAGLTDAGDVPPTYPRLDRPIPDMSGLVDQKGRPFEPSALSGRAALITFGYGHCETVCPLLVRSALQVRDGLLDQRPLTVVTITLDPWRDTPSRLRAIADTWGLGAGDVLLGGDVDAVEAALDAWDVPHTRDERTGEVIHPALTYLVEPDGTVAYASTGGPSQLRALALRLR